MGSHAMVGVTDFDRASAFHRPVPDASGVLARRDAPALPLSTSSAESAVQVVTRWILAQLRHTMLAAGSPPM